jgi:hypothetical protein
MWPLAKALVHIRDRDVDLMMSLCCERARPFSGALDSAGEEIINALFMEINEGRQLMRKCQIDIRLGAFWFTSVSSSAQSPPQQDREIQPSVKSATDNFWRCVMPDVCLGSFVS